MAPAEYINNVGRLFHRPHLVFILFKDKGHIAPSMILANKLAILHGISITVIFASQQELESSPPRESSHIQLLALDTQQGARTKAAALQATLDSLKRSELPPVAILVDIIVMWSADVIRHSRLPKFVLYTGSCSNLSVMVGISPALPKQWIDGLRAAQQPGLGDDPEMPDFTTREWFEDVRDARAVLVNSCQELEQSAMAELRDRADIPLVLPIGPLLDMDEEVKADEGTTPLASPCKQWLDDQPPASVIFISFGSRTFLCEEQIRELANALERSKRPFLWVLPARRGESSSKEFLDRVLPQGFMARNPGGLIVSGWAPQKMILRHPSVLAFVTHCGWNSILECLYAGTKPMLCWPFGADQPRNAQFVKEEIKAGLELAKDSSGVVRSGEIQAKIEEVAMLAVMNAAELTRCVRENNTSTRNLQTFAQIIANL